MNDYTCRIIRGEEEIYRSTERGIAPLIAIVDGGIDVAGAVAYDKIVGKAAALLYVLTGVGAVHAGVLGKAAARLFDENGIAYTYETLTENIINRKGDGVCPMEETVRDVDSPAAAYTVLKQKLRDMAKGA